MPRVTGVDIPPPGADVWNFQGIAPFQRGLAGLLAWGDMPEDGIPRKMIPWRVPGKAGQSAMKWPGGYQGPEVEDWDRDTKPYDWNELPWHDDPWNHNMNFGKTAAIGGGLTALLLALLKGSQTALGGGVMPGSLPDPYGLFSNQGGIPA